MYERETTIREKKKEEGKSRERVIDKDGKGGKRTRHEDKNVVTCGGKRDSEHRRWVSSVEIRRRRSERGTTTWRP